MARTKRYFAGEEVESDGNRGASGTSETIKPKSSVVTKEQLAESGLSLRDYMNKQQGLTRRGEPAPAPVPKSESEPETKSVAKDESKRPVSNSARNILEEAKENVRRSNVARSSMAEASRPKMEAGRLPKKGPGLSNFKSGGSVSSRADGIAQRGKTRGKMC